MCLAITFDFSICDLEDFAYCSPQFTLMKLMLKDKARITRQYMWDGLYTQFHIVVTVSPGSILSNSSVTQW